MSDTSVQLHLGDCLSYMRGMADKSVDCVITDPPYGIARVWKGGGGHGWGKARAQTQERNVWDETAPPKEVFDGMFRVGSLHCIWGGNYFDLPPQRGWLVWNKPERNFTLSEAELCWTSKDMPIRVFDYRRSDGDRVHPTQKPVALMKWCIELMTKPGDTVFDPFMGSGTTGVACMQTGRNFIGCEISPEYFAIAEKRIHEAKQQLRLGI